MNGREVHYTTEELRSILAESFLENTDTWGREERERAVCALEFYDNVEHFLKETKWERDNPEASSEKYLTENRICQWVDGCFLYFSRLIWEDDKGCAL